ncbi:cdk1, putative [Ricinus communis]|uniref:Cdk1, putative n=1 Tax=Ricinus communis TaxID=3988 RepID=B9S7B9_RICCO|nr:cdk1, putative [Ricinus communis]
METQYAVIDLIAEGAHGVVHKCRDRKTNQHTNIIRLLDVQIKENSVDLIYEYMDMTLHELIRTKPRDMFNCHLMKNILYQILSGLSYYHSHKILHRDMKPKNLLIDMDKGVLKIADFGLARAVGIPVNTLSTTIGTMSYRAPEILFGSTKYSASVDVWSTGCIFAEMVIGRPLFRGMFDADILFEIFRFFGVPNEDTWPGVTSLPEYASAFPPYLSQNLSEVLTGLEPDGLNLLTRMLILNPTKRITAEDALSDPYLKDDQNTWSL